MYLSFKLNAKSWKTLILKGYYVANWTSKFLLETIETGFLFWKNREYGGRTSRYVQLAITFVVLYLYYITILYLINQGPGGSMS